MRIPKWTSVIAASAIAIAAAASAATYAAGQDAGGGAIGTYSIHPDGTTNAIAWVIDERTGRFKACRVTNTGSGVPNVVCSGSKS
jgi:hypothetical protein